ncbi:hypothetical protein ES705_21591 [subsurface metagenome]
MPGYTRGLGMGRAWGRGRGMGYGRGIGYGRGMGYGRGYGIPIYTQYAQPQPIMPIASPENQLTMLKQQKDYLASEMNSIKEAIDEISKKITEFEKED